MLASAMRGGFIVCFLVVIKNLLTLLEMPPFWHGFVYSVNYSIGFVVIEETHSTLATKQPAFTASALASSLDTKKNTHQPNQVSCLRLAAPEPHPAAAAQTPASVHP